MNGNNHVIVSGHVSSELKFNHSVYDENFYLFTLEVSRDSGYKDSIPCIISEKLLDNTKDKYIGLPMQIKGQFRSYNKKEGENTRLILYVFVDEVLSFTESTGTNEIYLDGFVCKPPVFRKTPLGRKVADVLVAVNRQFGKSDYIPCICWGRNAYSASKLVPGSHIQIHGRVQSRNYNKQETKMIAYEISVSKLENVS